MIANLTIEQIRKIHDVAIHIENKSQIDILDYLLQNESKTPGCFCYHLWDKEVVIEPIENMKKSFDSLIEFYANVQSKVQHITFYQNDMYFGYSATD